MGYVRAALCLVLIALSSTPGLPRSAAAQAQTPPIGASAQLIDASAHVVAQVTFREAPDQVLISLAFPDRSAFVGVHAIHIHEVGRCDPPDFATAAGIFNPFGKQHGLKNPNGPMAGDVPSLVIGPSGVSAYNTSAPLVKLGPGPASLLRPGGTSLLLFARADDDQTQPDGSPGARIACGVISPQGPSANGVTDQALRQAQQAAGGGAPDLLSAFFIAALGALLIGAGVAVRRSPNTSRE